MKKRIISFALAFVFCFTCLSVIGLADADAHIHAAGEPTSLFVSCTDTTLTYKKPGSGFLTVETTGGSPEVVASSKTNNNVTASGNNLVFTGLTPNTQYIVKYYATLTATTATGSEQKTTQQSQTAPTAAPVVKTVTSNSVTFYSESQYQYAIATADTAPTADSEWKSTTGTEYTFTSLTAGTSYYLFSRFKASGSNAASPAGPSASVTTVGAAGSVSISGVAEKTGNKLELTIDKKAGEEYALSSAFATKIDKFEVALGASQTVYSRIAATGSSVAGAYNTTTINLPVVSFSTTRNGNTATLNYTISGNSFAVSSAEVTFSVTCGSNTYPATPKTGIHLTVGDTVSGSVTLTEAALGSFAGTAYYKAVVNGTVLGSTVKLGESIANAVLGTGSSTHTHSFTVQKVDPAYLKTAATATSPAVYYLSCTCGEKGTSTFTYSTTPAQTTVPHELNHTLCPVCKSCATYNCVRNFYGCNGTVAGCGYQSVVVPTTITHNAATHTLCPICGNCAVANCESNIYGCNGTANGCAKPSTTDTSKILKHQVFNKNTVTCAACGKINWGELTWTIYPCSAEAAREGASCFYICQECRVGIVFLTWDAVECKGTHSYKPREKDVSGTWIEYCEYCNNLHICAIQTACGHAESNYSLASKSINCEVAGTWTYRCTVCGETRDVAHKSSAHTWNEGIITKQATASVDGVKTYTCTTCGLTKTEVILHTDPCAEGHKFGAWSVASAATCTADGQEKRTCSVCQTSETRPIAKLNHNYGAWTVTKLATCTANGVETQTCSLCHDAVTRTIPATGHSYGEWFVDVAATCITEGSEKKVCSACGDSQTRTLAATGVHTFASDVSVPSVKTCVSCGLSYTVEATESGTTAYSFTDAGITLTIPKTTVSSMFFKASKQSSSAYSEWLDVLRNGAAISKDATFISGYKAELTENGTPVSLSSDATVSLKIPEDQAKNKLKVFAFTEDGGLAPVPSVEREGTSVSFNATEDFTGEFIVLSEKQNSTAPIVIAIIVVVLVACIGGSFLYKKGFFSI